MYYDTYTQASQHAWSGEMLVNLDIFLIIKLSSFNKQNLAWVSAALLLTA